MSYHLQGFGSVAKPLVPAGAVPALLAVKDTYGAFLLLLMQVNLNLTLVMGPMAFIVAPFILFSVALNAIPYLLISLAVDTNIDNTMKNEAASALRNIKRFEDLQKLPGASLGLNAALAGQLGTMNNAARIFKAFLTPIAAGKAPGPETIATTMAVLETMKDIEGVTDLINLVNTADRITGGAVFSKATKEKARQEQKAKNERLTAKAQQAAPAASPTPFRPVQRGAVTVPVKAFDRLGPTGSGKPAARPVQKAASSSTPLLLGGAALAVGLLVLARRR